MAMNNKIWFHTGGLMQAALFQEKPATDYELLVGSSTGAQGS